MRRRDVRDVKTASPFSVFLQELPLRIKTFSDNNRTVSELAIGPILTLLVGLVIMTLMYIIGRAPFYISTLFITIVISASLGGVLSGFMSALLTVIFSDIILYSPYPSILLSMDIPVVLFTILVSSFLTAYVVGILNRKALTATQERVLRERSEVAERKVRHILESITEAFFALDHNDRFIYLNNETERIFTISYTNLLGKNIWEAFPHLRKSNTYKQLQRVKKIQKTVSFEEYYPRANRWLDVHVYPTKEGLAVYFKDITERKEIEEHKNEFISLASHELKSPLTSLKGYVQLVEKTVGPEDKIRVGHYIERMEDEINRVNNLVSELLDLSKMESGQLQFKKEIVDLNVLIRDTVEDYQNGVSTHKIYIKGKVSHQVNVDRDRIRQVVINLLANAINYSPHSHKVVVLLREDNRNTVVSVQDFGIGIKADKLNKIFDRFYRITNGNIRSQGLGLGLYICSEIVKLSGGRIWVESTPGKGSTFSFLLPKETTKSDKSKNFLSF